MMDEVVMKWRGGQLVGCGGWVDVLLLAVLIYLWKLY